MEKIVAGVSYSQGHLSVPAAGRTIGMSLHSWVEPLAATFSALLHAATTNSHEDALVERYRATFSPLLPVLTSKVSSPELELRLAVSALLCEWLVARLANPTRRGFSFDEAERWFLGEVGGAVPGLVLSNTDWIPRDCLAKLEDVSFGCDFVDLLPYILEVFELVDAEGKLPSRTTRRARQRAKGVVYTPSDVSDFIVSETLTPWAKLGVSNGLPTCVDPACGTGPFLRSALSYLARIKHSADMPLWELVQCLYGMETSHQAIQSCAFVLLTHCLTESRGLPIAPWRVWQVIRGNLAVVDSTLVAPNQQNKGNVKQLRRRRTQLRHDLLSQRAPTASLPLSIPNAQATLRGGSEVITKPVSLSYIFPEVGDGFTVVFGNPPYSRLPYDGYQGIRAANFKTAPSVADEVSSLYPLFVEMIWRFGHPDRSSGGMVLPMSIAYSTVSQIARLRNAIREVPGDWRFAFFDRTPDSLFGDDVKTRNTIVLWHHDGSTANTCFWTGPLVRWNSRNRKDLFRELAFVKLGKYPIARVIPKLGSHMERDVYLQLRGRRFTLAPLVRQIPISALELGAENPRVVFLSSTGYNWISTFREVPTWQNEVTSVGVPPSVRAIACPTEDDAAFAFASLSSRLVYWLWRVEGDGFHVTYDFVRRLPFHPSVCSLDDRADLLQLAGQLWSEMQRYPVESTNAGRTRVSYYPYACRSSLDAIDAILIRNLALPADFLPFLRRFVRENILAGRQEELRTNPALRRLILMEDADE
jgi:hypothetical protein